MTDARERQADALIDHLQREQGGRLTIFLGAAPGVGKTYTMLSRARELRRQGRDVVVGIVETHGRGETAAGLLQPSLGRIEVAGMANGRAGPTGRGAVT